MSRAFIQVRIVLLLLGGFVASTAAILLISYARFSELGVVFEDKASQKYAYRTISLVNRYKLLRDRARKDRDTADYINETKLVLSWNESLRDEAFAKKNIPLEVGKAILNFTNLLLGGQELKTPSADSRSRALEQAYFFEIKRHYRAAADKFGEILTRYAAYDNLYFFSALHYGFCLSLLGEKKEAIRRLSELLKSPAAPEYKITANALLHVIQELETGIARLALMPDSPAKAEGYYLYSAYFSAIDVFEKQSDQALGSRGKFYLARSYEETGQSEKAVKGYRRIINTDATSQWAIKANRRLYLLGALYDPQLKTDKEAIENANQKFLDSEFLKEMSSFKYLMEKNQQKINNIQETGIGSTKKDTQTEVRTKEAPKPPETGVKIAPQRNKTDSPPSRIVKIIRENIVMSDGNIIEGTLVGETGSDVRIRTSIGVVSISKEKIAKRRRY